MHAAVARPAARPFQHRRLHGDPVGARQLVKRGARVIVPILAGLHAVAATDALGRVKQNAPRFAVQQATGRHQIPVFLGQCLS